MTRGSCLNNLWTDALVAKAMRLRDVEKLTNQAIADRLGIPAITRNAVIGKLRRMDAAAGTITIPPPKIKRADRVERMKDWQPKPRAPDKLEIERKRLLRVRGHGNRVSRRNVRTPGGITRSKQAAASVSRPLEAKTIQAAPKPVVEPVSATNVSLLDLPFFGACKFPVGLATGRDQMFCGGAVDGETDRYCGHHKRVAYQPPQARKRPPGYNPKPVFEEA